MVDNIAYPEIPDHQVPNKFAKKQQDDEKFFIADRQVNPSPRHHQFDEMDTRRQTTISLAHLPMPKDGITKETSVRTRKKRNINQQQPSEMVTEQNKRPQMLDAGTEPAQNMTMSHTNFNVSDMDVVEDARKLQAWRMDEHLRNLEASIAQNEQIHKEQLQRQQQLQQYFETVPPQAPGYNQAALQYDEMMNYNGGYHVQNNNNNNNCYTMYNGGEPSLMMSHSLSMASALPDTSVLYVSSEFFYVFLCICLKSKSGSPTHYFFTLNICFGICI
jgi:hypothetical protein